MKRILTGFLISLFILSQGYCATGWDISKPAGISNASDIDANVIANNTALDLMLQKYQQGCKLTYASVATLTVGSGGVMVSNSAGTTRLMLANSSNTTVSWSDLDTPSEASSSTYYIYAIGSATTDTTFTVKISLSASAPTGVTYYKRLGSFYNDTSSNITQIANDEVPVNAAYVKGQGNYYKIDSGTVSVAKDTNVTISFSFTFGSAPVVIVTQLYNSDGDFLYNVFLKSIGTSSAVVRQHNEETLTIQWIAIGQVLAQ